MSTSDFLPARDDQKFAPGAWSKTYTLSGVSAVSASNWHAYIVRNKGDVQATASLIAPTVSVSVSANTVTFSLTATQVATLIGSGASKFAGYWSVYSDTLARTVIAGHFVIDRTATNSGTSSSPTTLTVTSTTSTLSVVVPAVVSTVLDTWNAARDAAATTVADIVCLTDSIGVLGSVTAKPWPHLLAKTLSAFDSRAEGAGWVFANGNGAAVIAMDSCAGTASTTGAGGYASDMTAGQVAYHTMTCDGVSVVYTKQSGGGSIEVRDGGSGGTLITTISTANATTLRSQVTTVNLTTYASRQVHLTVTGGPVHLEGIYGHAGDQTTGTRVWCPGHSGYKTSDFVSNSTLAMNLVASLDPALVIIATGYNDVSAAQYEADLRTLIAMVQAQTGNNVAVMSPWGGVAGAAVGLAKAQAAERVAGELGLAFFDLYGMLGSVDNAVDPWDLSADGAHPRPGASQMMADLVLSKVAVDPTLVAISTPERGPREYLGTLSNRQGIAGQLDLTNLLGYPVAALYGAEGDVNAQMILFNGTLGAALGAPGAGISLGAGGGSAADTSITRDAAGVVRVSAALKVPGLTGATAASRYVGATASGAPASGTFIVGDFVIDQTGRVWICTTAGTPGTWTDAAAAAQAAAIAASAQRSANLSDLANAGTAWTNLGGGTAGKLASDTDGTLTANSDTRIPSQKAVKTYADTKQLKSVTTVKADGTGDYATLELAVAGVSSGTIVVGTGTHTVNTGSMNPAAGVRVRGEAGAVVVAKNALNTNIFEITHDYVTIEGLEVDGNKANQASPMNCIKFSSPAKGGRVLNCKVHDAYGYNIVGFPGVTDMLVSGCISEDALSEGIEFQGVVRGVIANNVVRNAGKNGIYVWANTAGGGTCNGVTVTGNEVYNSAALTAGFAGIRVDDGATDVTVIGNTVVGGGTTCPGISIASSTATAVKDIAVVGNTVRSATSNGITVSVANNVTVTGNTVSAPTTYGISCGTTVTNVVIEGNTVRAAGSDGINVGTGNNIAVVGNSVVSAGANGINCAATKSTITGNLVTSATTSGIQVGSSAHQFEVVGNTVNGCTQRGIYILSSNYGTVSNNAVSANGGTTYDGITLSTCIGVAVAGNRVDTTGAAGIFATSSSACTFTGNFVMSARTAGIYCIDSTNGTITGNVCINNGTNGNTTLYNGILVYKNSATTSGFIISGNRCYDTSGGSGTQGYGIRVVGAADNILIAGNLTEGNKVGGQLIDGTATNVNAVPYRKVTATVNSTQTTIAHGLPYTPLAVSVVMTSAGTVWRSASSDATNIYLTADTNGRTCDVLVG